MSPLSTCLFACLGLLFGGLDHDNSVDGAAQPEVPTPVEGLREEDPAVRRDAAMNLDWWSRAEAEIAVPALSGALRDTDVGVRSAAVLALSNIDVERAGPSIVGAIVRALVGALEDTDRRVRQAAAENLGSIGQGDRVAVSALAKSLEDPSSWVRRAAAEALGQGGAGSAVSPLVRALNDVTPHVRRAAAEALGTIEGEASTAIRSLIESLEDFDADVRTAAAGALGRFGGEAKGAVPALVAALRDGDGRAAFSSSSIAPAACMFPEDWRPPSER